MTASSPDNPPSPAAVPSEAVSAERIVTIVNQKGLHARAAAKFVKLAVQFDAAVTVSKNDSTVSGASIMGLMMLAASPGCQIHIRASGRQAGPAIEALGALVAGGFDEK